MLAAYLMVVMRDRNAVWAHAAVLLWAVGAVFSVTTAAYGFRIWPAMLGLTIVMAFIGLRGALAARKFAAEQTPLISSPA